MSATAKVYSTGRYRRSHKGIQKIEYFENGKLVRTMHRGEYFTDDFGALEFLLEVGLLDNMTGETLDGVEWVRV